ncbi:hypothetical protein CEXT_344831 [Caerostris extrusa]|uniref:Uncharacterized protein n=1 Tax=Caerostris extrusa TaxID=172846 RepID=A0AAV4P1R2_CAEEX|nr:hypothetical protein CEXT_344831 [Caerostris extrusa]
MIPKNSDQEQYYFTALIYLFHLEYTNFCKTTFLLFICENKYETSEEHENYPRKKKRTFYPEAKNLLSNLSARKSIPPKCVILKEIIPLGAHLCFGCCRRYLARVIDTSERSVRKLPKRRRRYACDYGMERLSRKFPICSELVLKVNW